MQPRPFEEWIEKGHQRDTNLCGACARPTDERSLVRGGRGYNQGSFVYFSCLCIYVRVMMMIAFITFKSSLVPLFEGL